MTPPAKVTIHLDAIRLDDLCDFYRTLLGFRVVETQHAGLLTEARTLESEQYPAFRLVFQSCHPRPPMASACGTIRTLEFEVDDPARVAARITEPKWITPLPGSDEPTVSRLILQDSTGYHVALVRRPEGSA